MHARLAPLLRVARAGRRRPRRSGRASPGACGQHAAARPGLAATGQLRHELDLEEVADVIWATNSPEFYCLLVEDRAGARAVERWLADGWCRLLLN